MKCECKTQHFVSVVCIVARIPKRSTTKRCSAVDAVTVKMGIGNVFYLHIVKRVVEL
jgi:hypothetical protein